MLLEKRDMPRKGQADFVVLNARNNIYEAFGSYLKDPFHQWVRETSTGAHGLDLNTHVMYIHSKFLLQDPLGRDPIIVTGSANFSKDSILENDENMVVIRGDLRAADIYFTEFNRLFQHYYFRSVHQLVRAKQDTPDTTVFLAEDTTWLDKYKPGTLRAKRIDVYREMYVPRGAQLGFRESIPISSSSRPRPARVESRLQTQSSLGHDSRHQ
jgi:phosphatidylserine/phosphatidylglycerophosphate/cardiolipin synthase-like enzyme